MRWLIRRVLKKGKGSVSYEEDIHFGEVLSIGRASDQAIFLPDLRAALNHARVSALGNGRYKVESLILAGIRVNGQITYSTTVGPGAVVEIGTTRLTLLEARQDYDATVEVATLDKSEQEAAVERTRKPTSLAGTWIGKRTPSWIGFLLVLVLFLVLPAASHYVPPLATVLRVGPLPSTAAWNPGPIATAHHFFADDCTRCHQHAFLQVRDTACTTCHAGTKAHADAARFNLPELGDARCGSCHQDHNGPRGLIRQDQRLCADCHGGLANRTAGASKLDDVSDFGTHHPQFRVNLPAWNAQGQFEPIVMRWDAKLKEVSGLKFNHEKHLQPDLSTPNGRRTLTCANCHQPETGGAAMKPIAFETMCHECHRLGFDTLSPGREVPHANVTAVRYTLDEFYSGRALEGGYADARSPAIVQERRRPGAPALSRQEQFEALSWARERARMVTDTLFTGKACVTCHTVNRDAKSGDWTVAPVRVAGQWYVEARFSHARHGTMQCVDCHAGATESHDASDLLVPGIDNCRQCHAGANTRGKVASTCIACHDFHRASQAVLVSPRIPAESKP